MPARRLPPYVQKRTLRDGTARYRGWYTAVDGQRKFCAWRTTPQKAHADAVTARGLPPPALVGGSIEARAKEWLEAAKASLTDDTIDFYTTKLATIYRVTIPRTLPLERVSVTVLRQFVHEATEAGLAARTIQHCRRTLNRLFVWCMKRGLARENPVPLVDWPRPRDVQPPCFTEVELFDLLQAITDQRARDLAVFIAFTGLRRAEVARTEIALIDHESAVLWIRGKTRNQSHPLPPEASDAAKRLAEGRDGTFLIPGETDRARREHIAETFRAQKALLKEPRFRPHALRHTVATIMLRKGASPATVQRFLRHSSYAMTQRYVHMVEDDVRGATAKLRLLPGGQVEQKSHG